MNAHRTPRLNHKWKCQLRIFQFSRTAPNEAEYRAKMKKMLDCAIIPYNKNRYLRVTSRYVFFLKIKKNIIYWEKERKKKGKILAWALRDSFVCLDALFSRKYVHIVCLFWASNSKIKKKKRRKDRFVSYEGYYVPLLL